MTTPKIPRKPRAKHQPPEMAEFQQDGSPMPVAFSKDSLTLWYGFHGWTKMSAEEAVVLAEAILARYKPKA